MRLLLLVSLLAVACNRSSRERTSERPDPDPDTVTVAELWEAYSTDAADAERRFGRGVRIVIPVESVDKSLRGFLVKCGEGRVTHRFYFPADAADRLQGAAGRTITARGKVAQSTRGGLVVNCD